MLYSRRDSCTLDVTLVLLLLVKYGHTKGKSRDISYVAQYRKCVWSVCGVCVVLGCYNGIGAFQDVCVCVCVSVSHCPHAL